MNPSSPLTVSFVIRTRPSSFTLWHGKILPSISLAPNPREKGEAGFALDEDSGASRPPTWIKGWMAELELVSIVLKTRPLLALDPVSLPSNESALLPWSHTENARRMPRALGRLGASKGMLLAVSRPFLLSVLFSNIGSADAVEFSLEQVPSLVVNDAS